MYTRVCVMDLMRSMYVCLIDNTVCFSSIYLVGFDRVKLINYEN
jgi:hypothetical protein